MKILTVLEVPDGDCNDKEVCRYYESKNGRCAIFDVDLQYIKFPVARKCRKCAQAHFDYLGYTIPAKAEQ